MHADVLVVGAGLAGAAAARALAEAGRSVAVLDKGRGPGGRLSTRRNALGGFDHGAAWLQADAGGFAAWLEAEAAHGRAARHRAGWVGVPGMNALVAGLLAGLDVRWSAAVAALRREPTCWQALDADGRVLATASALVLAVPAPQAAALLRAGHPSPDVLMQAAIAALATVRYAPCWVALIEVEPGLSASRPDPEALPEVHALHREADKPGRPDVGHWVLQATAAWSEANLEASAEAIAPRLRAAFIATTGLPDAAIRQASAHRWRYAHPTQLLDPRSIALDGLYLAGDAFADDASVGMAPAERAWVSGRAAATRLLDAGQPKS